MRVNGVLARLIDTRFACRREAPSRVLREQTMLCNPRTPASVLKSTATVDVSSVGSVQPDGSDAAEKRPAGRALVASLQETHANTKVLRLSSVPPDYRAVLGSGEVEAFENTMRGCAPPPRRRAAARPARALRHLTAS